MRLITHRFLAVLTGLYLALSTGDAFPAPSPLGPVAPYELRLSAVLAGSGVTTVTLQILTAAETPPAVAHKIQLKSEDLSSGATFWTRNFTNIPLTEFTLPGGELVKQCSLQFTDLSRRMPLSAQVSIKSEDSTKGEILRASTLVLLCPDLQVSSIEAPPWVAVLQPTDIRVVVLETNGDLGARFDVLLLDAAGLEVDRCTGLSVGPSGSSTAVMSVRLPTLGTHWLTARIVNSDPGETNPANNEGSVSIDVRPVTARWEWSTEFRDYRLDNHYSFTEVKQPSGSWHTEFDNHGASEYAYVSARTATPLAWPWNVTGTLKLDGVDRITMSRSGVLPDVTQGDPHSGGPFLGTYRSFDPETNADLQIIVYSSGADDGSSYTLASLHQLATDCIQYSSGYYNNWYGSTYTWSATNLIREGSFVHATGSLQGLVVLSADAGSFGGWTGVTAITPFSDHRTTGGFNVRFDEFGARIDTTYTSTVNEEGYSASGFGVSNP